MSWYLNVVKNYVGFQGRARRKEYWMFVLFNAIISAIIYAIEMLIGTIGIISMLYSLAVLLPSLAVTARRLHDIGKSGWWILIAFVPFVGGIILFVFTCLDSQSSTNQHGPNPKHFGVQA